MSPLLTLYLDQFLIFVLVLTRVGSLLMTLPVLGTATVPWQVRALLTAAISLILTPLFWGQPIPPPENLLMLGTLLAREAILGLALRERAYSAVMAATGLLYLAILTAFGTDLVARAVLSG